MDSEHWYYLHINGCMIHKVYQPDPSDFVKRIWRLDITSRLNAWDIILEALALGANINEIKRLKDRWDCNYGDLKYYLRNKLYVSVTDEQRNGLKIFLKEFYNIDSDDFFNRMREINGYPDLKDVQHECTSGDGTRVSC